MNDTVDTSLMVCEGNLRHNVKTGLVDFPSNYSNLRQLLFYPPNSLPNSICSGQFGNCDTSIAVGI